MEEALRNHEELDNRFIDIKPWDKYDCCSTRKVWLEVVGVPPHGWKWENFKKIADIWGYLISLGKPIARTDTFESMRLLIETNILVRIDDDFIFTLGDLGFRVIVRKIGPAFQTLQRPYFSSRHSDEVADSNGEIPGFEDIEKVGETDANSGKEDQTIEDGLVEATHHDHGKEHRVARANSKFGNGCEEPAIEKAADSIHSTTRTKTAIFSQSERLDEVAKGYTHLSSLGPVIKEVHNVSIEESPQEPPSFENRAVTRLSNDSINRPLVNSRPHNEAHITRPVEAQVEAQVSNGWH